MAAPAASASRPISYPIPPRLWEDLPYKKTPWKVSDSIAERLTGAPGLKYKKCEVLSSDPEARFIMRYFEAQKPASRTIGKVFYIHNPTEMAEFEARVQRIDEEASKPTFAPNLKDESHPLLREKTIRRWHTLVDQFSPISIGDSNGHTNSYWKTKVLPLWHGSNKAICEAICQTGFAFFGKKHIPGGNKAAEAFKNTDDGFFGSGIYFTNSARYAADAYSPDGHLMLGWVAMREPFPVIADRPYPSEPTDMTVLSGRGAYKNYNAHYIPVTPMTPEDPLNFFPCTDKQEPVWDEFVVFQQPQTLARFWVVLQPDGVPPSLSLQKNSIEDLIRKIDTILTFPQCRKNASLVQELQQKKIEIQEIKSDVLPAAYEVFYHNIINSLQAIRGIERGDQKISDLIFDACHKGDLKRLEAYLSPNYLSQAKKAFNPTGVIDADEHQGWTPLHEAAFWGHLPIVISLLKAFPGFLETKEHLRKDGYTPFHAAAAGNHLDVLQALYNFKPAWITSSCNDKYTPLRAALDGRHERVVKWLIETDSEVFELNTRDSQNPLTSAQANQLLQILSQSQLIAPKLDLRRNNLNDKIAPALNLVLQSQVRLQNLQLGENSLGDSCIAQIEKGLIKATGMHGMLDEINLKLNKLTDISAQYLADVIKSSVRLHLIDLSSNYISDDGAIVLARALQLNTSLRGLVLFNCQITDKGVKEFLKVLKNRKEPLKLNLLDNKISDVLKEAFKLLAGAKKERKPLDGLLLDKKIDDDIKTLLVGCYHHDISA